MMVMGGGQDVMMGRNQKLLMRYDQPWVMHRSQNIAVDAVKNW